jgi:uncharacterized membrane protein
VSPALVGVVVDEPTVSSANTVQFGGVLSTVTLVVADFCASAVLILVEPRLNIKISANAKTPIIDVYTVILPAVRK